MKKLFLILLLFAVPVTANDFKIQDRPIIKVPVKDRQSGWLKRMPGKTKRPSWDLLGVFSSKVKTQGSCVHACMVTLLRYQGQHDLAADWQTNHGGGAWHNTLISDLEEEDIPYRTTFEEKDIAFLERAMSEKLGTLVTTEQGLHMLLLVHLGPNEAAIIDPNEPTVIKWMDREKFLADWFEAHSWATTVLLKTPRKQ